MTFYSRDSDVSGIDVISDGFLRGLGYEWVVCTESKMKREVRYETFWKRKTLEAGLIVGWLVGKVIL